MNTALVVLAIVVAVLSVPTVAGLTAWGLSGGDGEADNVVVGILGALVGLGGIYNAVVSYRALWEIPEWAWWLMWVPLTAGSAGLLLSIKQLNGLRDALLGLGLQLTLGVPAALVWAAGAVG